MVRYESQFKGKPSNFLFYLVVTMCVAVHCQQLGRPRLVSRPSNPLIGKSNGTASFYWVFELLPTETWNESIYELSFGLWSSPGYLKKKLMAIDRRGQVLVRPNYENKIGCNFNMSRLQVEFTLRSLSKEDAKHYGLHVEFVSARAPLLDTVILRVEDPLKTTSPLQENVTMRKGDQNDPPKTTSPLQENATVRKGDQNVPSTPSPSKALIVSSPLISISVICGCVVVLTVTVLVLRYRRRHKKDIPYEPQIDAKKPRDHSIPTAL